MQQDLFQIVDLCEISPTLSRVRPHITEVTLSSDHLEFIQDVQGNYIYIYIYIYITSVYLHYINIYIYIKRRVNQSVPIIWHPKLCF